MRLLAALPAARPSGITAQRCMSTNVNALLDRDHQGLPRFTEFEESQIAPAMEAILVDFKSQLGAIEEAAEADASWASVMDPLEKLEDNLEFGWGLISHLESVKNSDQLRKEKEKVQPDVIAVSTLVSQSKRLYTGTKRLSELSASGKLTLDEAQQRIVDSSLRSFELGGVGLEGEAKERFNKIKLELAELGTTFSNNVLDATKAFSLTLTKPEEVDGFPPSLLALTAQAARQAGEEPATAEAGPWLITLDFPCYGPLLSYANSRELREKVYRASISKASESGTNNNPIMARILALRQEKAQLLGFANHAEISLSQKMAPSVSAVYELLGQLKERSKAAAERELQELRDFSVLHHVAILGPCQPLMNWDVPYYAEKMKQEKFGFSEEELRQYFPLPTVLSGLFDLSSRLFGIRIVEEIPSAELGSSVWHEDVRFYRIYDDVTGKALAAFFLDPFSRPAEKRGGAWMNVCVGRSKILAPSADETSSHRLPVAYLICNQSPPTDGKPSLMSLREVETL
jgi:oligopeptidase A